MTLLPPSVSCSCQRASAQVTYTQPWKRGWGHWIVAELPPFAPHPRPQPWAHAASQGWHRKLWRHPLPDAAPRSDHAAEWRL
eukprot:645116-Pelagomonas_calceolata.AAC.1